MRMSKHLVAALYVLTMVAIIVGIDITIFRHRPWERLLANAGIVLLFAACYLRFFRQP
jgi:predicted cobalt transporter CbtA